MAYFTALVLGLFVTYIGGWFLGRIEGNMALLLSLGLFVARVPLSAAQIVAMFATGVSGVLPFWVFKRRGWL